MVTPQFVCFYVMVGCAGAGKCVHSVWDCLSSVHSSRDSRTTRQVAPPVQVLRSTLEDSVTSSQHLGRHDIAMSVLPLKRVSHAIRVQHSYSYSILVYSHKKILGIILNWHFSSPKLPGCVSICMWEGFVPVDVLFKFFYLFHVC